MTDVHSHFLPGIDDGAGNLKVSVKLLHECYLQKISGIIATPHFYSDCPVEEFLENRQKAYEQVKDVLEQIRYPFPIALGAEVYFTESLPYYEQLPELCIGSSPYLLLELPFQQWGNSVYNVISGMRSNHGIKPIIAHLERYGRFNPRKNIEAIFDMGVLVQMNAGFILNEDTRKAALTAIKQGRADFLGSDCHNLASRPENLRQAYDIIRDAGLREAADRLEENGDELLAAALKQ